MMQDASSLDNLHDIVLPGPTPWWPPAPGWYVLGVLLFVAFIGVIVYAARSWRLNRYRAAGQRQVHDLRRRVSAGGSAELISDLNEVLKRVALVAWPRSSVSQLSGQAWIDFLQATAPKTTFSLEQIATLRDVAYSRKISEGLTGHQLESLFGSAETWIRKHATEADLPSVGSQGSSL